MEMVNTKYGKLSLNQRFLSFGMAGMMAFTLTGCSAMKNDKNLIDTTGSIVVSAVSKNEDGMANVAGVSFEVVDENNKVIEEWVSNEERHSVSNLADGKYTVKVMEEASGYDLVGSGEMTLTVNREEHIGFYDVSFELVKEKDLNQVKTNTFVRKK